MPLEVIMPALGMAQDTGLIVAWLKAEGDEVAKGDALFEVETDKATMEVEAQGAGYLTNVRAGEGDSVPVGDVIALISESAEGTPDPAPTDGAEVGGDYAAPDPHTESAKAPEGRKVIMPALGMAQDTGRIVDWLVGPGDAVKDGDPLFEVETDKATMEVPSDTDGFVAAMYAEAGDDVPVGDVIAIISKEKPDAPVRGKAAPAPAPQAKAETPQATGATQETKPTPAATTGGRILASPKAKRLARERGLDLQRLQDAGVAQPFHVADLDRAEATQPPVTAPAPASRPQTASLQIEARAPSEAFDTLSGRTDRTALFAAFSAGALRAATRADHVAVELRPSAQRLDDPDLPRTTPQDTPPALLLRDLSDTRLTRLDTGVDAIPTITLTRDGTDLILTLCADPDAMGEQTAIDLITGLADRIADPLRQLF